MLIAAGALLLSGLVAFQQKLIDPVWVALAIAFAWFVLWRLFKNHREETAVSTQQPAAPDAKTDRESLKWKTENISLQEGARWIRAENAIMERCEIRLLSIVDAERAKISIDLDLGTYMTGSEVERDKGSRSTFIVPQSSTFDADRVVVSATARKEFFRLFGVRIEHINPHSKSVELEMTFAQGSRW